MIVGCDLLKKKNELLGSMWKKGSKEIEKKGNYFKGERGDVEGISPGANYSTCAPRILDNAQDFLSFTLIN